MIKCEIDGKNLIVYVSHERIPDHDFVNRCLLRKANILYGGNIATLFKDIIKNEQFSILFTPNDYLDLDYLLRKYFIYTAKDATVIAQWVIKYIYRQNDGINWLHRCLDLVRGIEDE